MTDDFWTAFVLIGAGGFGIGFGLVVGAFVARYLRRYMRAEGWRLNGDRGTNGDK